MSTSMNNTLALYTLLTIKMPQTMLKWKLEAIGHK